MADRTGTAQLATPSTRRGIVVGMVLVVISAIAWSSAGFFARVAPVDIWIVLFWRSLFGGLSIVALAMIQRRVPR